MSQPRLDFEREAFVFEARRIGRARVVALLTACGVANFTSIPTRAQRYAFLVLMAKEPETK